jgi:hypothetical protein
MIEFNLACYASVTGRFEVTVQGHQMKTLKFRMMASRFFVVVFLSLPALVT